MRKITRRQFLALTVVAGTQWPLSRIVAAQTESTPRLLEDIIHGPENTYFTYPHANGFLGSTDECVIARPSDLYTDFIAFNPASRATRSIGQLEKIKMYYSISLDGTLVAPTSTCLHSLKLSSGEHEILHRLREPWKFGDIADIDSNGTMVAFDSHFYGTPQQHHINLLTISTRNTQLLVNRPWLANHPSFSPYDPNWICFSRDGSGDRMWAWNQTRAPQGVVLFNQIAANGERLNVGHERPLFNAASSIVVAAGDSAGKPTGLYRSDYAQLGAGYCVSPAARDWHCNISRDGRWAVVDSMGEASDSTPPPAGWAEKGGVSDIVAVSMKTGKREVLCRVTFERKHPYHPHPHISPSGRFVILNDAASKSVWALRINQTALAHFLQ